MDPERMRQLQELYHRVREAAADERAALLADADPELRWEAESLLAQRTTGFAELPPIAATGMLRLLESAAPTVLPAGTDLGPYRIDARLGTGGMGEVYRAIDTRLGRAVAVKIGHLRFTDRFRREAHAIAALNHPNICTLYDVGPDYLVMELVEGETLAARLKSGALPLRTAMVYATQILSALAEAHARGIVHRDLKPGNIMVAKSGVKILDFGLAKSVGDETLTVLGGVMGTPAYMAPEQKQGGSADARSDLYAFGCILQEMLTGERPGPARKGVRPRRLDAIIARALEEDPAHRWQTAVDTQRALAAIVVAGKRWRGAGRISGILASLPARITAVACILAIAAATAAAFFRAERMHPLSDQDTIVLAGFTNRTGDPVLEGTLQQGLAVQLEQSPFLSIISDNQVRQTLSLMGRAPGTVLTPELALELCQRVGSAAVIQGSIVRIGTPYQLTLRAVDCADGRAIASVADEAANKDRVLGTLGSAASRLRSRLGESLGSVRRFDTALEQATTPSLDALKAYSDGQRILASGSDTPAAVVQFRRAIELDPQFALAYGALTIAYTALGESRLAADAAREAYALRNRVSEPEKYFIAARYGKSATGNIDMAIQATLAWIQAYPRSPLPRAMLAGSIYPVVGEFDKAATQLTESLGLLPALPVTYAFLMDAYTAMNQFDQAEATWERAHRLGLHSGFYALNRYQLAFLRHDRVGMDRQVAASMGRQGLEDQILAYEAETVGYSGQLTQSRALSERAVESAERAGERESAATYRAMSALREALFGNASEAVRRAGSALARSPARDVQFGAALAFLYAGNPAQAEALIAQLAGDYPEDTLAQGNYLPALRAKLALVRGNPTEALAILEAATLYGYGVTRSSALAWTSMYPIYVRGEAYLATHDGAKAAAEFRKIIDHRGIALAYPIGPMARIGLARSLAITGDRSGAVAAYGALLDLWKNADPDVPALGQARLEAAALR